MNGDKILGMVNGVKAMAEEMVEKHRGDGLAQPALDLCNALLETRPEEVIEDPVDDDTDDTDDDDDPNNPTPDPNPDQ